MSPNRLPPLDLHAHVADVGATPIVEGASIFGQTLTPAQWDEVTADAPVPGVVWGLGLHPIYTNSPDDLDGFLDRLPACHAVGEIGLDNTGLSPISAEEQRTILSAILSRNEAQARILSVHALLAYADVAAMLTDYPTPGAIIHWYCGPGEALRTAVAADVFFSVNDAVVANADQAVVLPDLPRHRVLAETDSPYIDRTSGQPLNPWADTQEERAQGRALKSGEVRPIEQSLGKLWGIDADEVRWQLWRNLAELESRVSVRPFGAAEMLRLAGFREAP